MRNKQRIPATHNKSNLRIFAANMCPNPLDDVDKKWLNYSKDELSLDISCVHSKDIDNETFEWMTSLTEDMMKEYYDKSESAWNKKSKEKEFRSETARILLVRDSSTKHLVAFVHFRFELDDEQKFPVVYCYEIQMSKDVQRKGLGRHLMASLVAIGSRFKMNKVMITCFKHNIDAFTFYEKLGYVVDVASPSKCGEDKSYEIMNFKIRA
ncbi:N-alpha-acetyltransferase 40 [Halotydeus destructor]|nr:N-alpha-acetyltransferase 40 [Halotydeus destructor]